MMTNFTSKDKWGSARGCVRAMLVLGAVMTVSACGIKPGELMPPGGENAPSYPGTYPKPH